jgi:phosphomannomutase/phosphoglucomutase
MINPLIFRQYDIRGIVGKDLTNNVVNSIGKSFGSYIIRKKCRNVVVGNDVRPSSTVFHDIIVDAIRSTGCNIFDVGTVPISAFYFSIIHYKMEGGIYITGSHNPVQYNGFKINFGSESIFGEEIQKLKDIAMENIFEKGYGDFKKISPLGEYINTIKKGMKMRRKIKVVVDCGNGTNSLIVPKLLRDIGCDVIELYCEPDGTFPNHLPDPTLPENLKDLINKVNEENANFGVAYDGDGDRIGVVDEKGNILWGDKLMILFSREILKKHPGSKILIEVKCSQSLIDDIKDNDGVPILCKTGHSLIKNEMKIQNALLAGEMSGHIFFADEYFGFDDAIYATIRLIKILSETGKKLSELLADVKKYHVTPEIRIDCSDEKKFEVVEKMKKYFKEKYDTIDIDGVRVLFEDGWALVRASNTEPKLILRFECETEEGLKRIKNVVEDKLNEILG